MTNCQKTCLKEPISIWYKGIPVFVMSITKFMGHISVAIRGFFVVGFDNIKYRIAHLAR